MENLKPVEILEKTLDTLNSDECEVLKLFFGIKDGSEHSVEDIANNLGKSVDEVKETYAKAVRKLRHPSRKNTISSAEFISAVSEYNGYKELAEVIAGIRQ